MIPCLTSERMSLIFQRFQTQLELENSRRYYLLYRGERANIEFSFEGLANNEDERRHKMNILVVDENIEEVNDVNLKESEEIICQECKQNALIKIEDYRITTECKNKHLKKNLSIKEFVDSQKIDISQIMCDICKIRNQSNIYNNEIYRCITCEKNICPLCKTRHGNQHIIVKYEERNIKCKIHNEKFVKYCNDCNKDICMECIEEEHNNHKGVFYGDMLSSNDMNEYKKYLDIFIDKINEIIAKLEEIKNNMIIYNNKYNRIMNNKKKRNYETLKNIIEFNKYNNIIIEDIKEIINEKDINYQFGNIMKIYNKISGNISIIKAEFYIK